ncbi:MAG TPA: hypothetical protein VIL65_10305 [Beijerinckiaceae bacterium]|jgi:hypothetical protein
MIRKPDLFWPTLAAASLAASVAFAQAPAQPRDPNMPDPKTVPAEKIAPQEPATTGATGQTLSDKLSATEGVITPPGNASPDMRVAPPVPNPGTTPVIPPPGEAGGTQRIQPK